MPWIQNISFEDIKNGFHFDPGENSMLIQIVDPDMEFPVPKFSFKKVHQFKFLDIEEDHTFSIKDHQAEQIADLLKTALDQCMNVTVHCVAGVCRSGAVAEAGVALGFVDTETFRIPNVLVKKKIFEQLF